MDKESSTSSPNTKKRKREDYICLGTDNFDKIIKEDAAFIDKTMFIKEWMENGDEVSVILRPRRFGKSTNLSMLKSFFSHGAQSKDFSRFSIWKETDFVNKHCGKYPVVFLNMKDIVGNSWKEMFRTLSLILQDELRHHKDRLAEDDMKAIFEGAVKPDEAVAGVFLKRLTEQLKGNCNEDVIVLIDEYDAPLNHAFRKGFHQEAINFFGCFYSNGLKSNENLKRSCLVGIVEMRGDGILSGLNNLVIYSCADEKFSQFFGFTMNEISKFLYNDVKRIKDVVEWYNGYYMGPHKMINPWSFMNYIRKNNLKSYWVQTANIDSIRSIISPILSLELIQILVQLYEGNDHKIEELETKVNYGQSPNIPLILCFFVHTGYLTYKDRQVSMPNKEIRYEWRKCSFGVEGPNMIEPAFGVDIINTLKATPFEVGPLQNFMSNKLPNCSFHYLQSENSYHLFYFGIFNAVCGSGMDVTSNKEGGHGRYDIRITIDELKRMFIIEFKKSKNIEDLEKDAKEGLQQIHEKKYYQDNKYYGWTCVAIGVSFIGKRMSKLKCEEIFVSQTE